MDSLEFVEIGIGVGIFVVILVFFILNYYVLPKRKSITPAKYLGGLVTFYLQRDHYIFIYTSLVVLLLISTVITGIWAFNSKKYLSPQKDS